jgi:hypothetical protein
MALKKYVFLLWLLFSNLLVWPKKGQTQCQRLPHEWGLGKGITEVKSYPCRNSAEKRLRTQNLVARRASTHQLHQACPSLLVWPQNKNFFHLWPSVQFRPKYVFLLWPLFFELTCMTSKQKFLSSMTFRPIQANDSVKCGSEFFSKFSLFVLDLEQYYANKVTHNST